MPTGSPPAANGPAHVTAAPSDAESPPQGPSAAARYASHESRAEQQPADAASPASDTDGDDRGTGSSAGAAASGPTRSADDRATATDATATGSGQHAAGAGPEGGRWRHPHAATLRGPVRRQVSRLVGWASKRPLEAAAVVLMGIGGPIFPPVFLIGATLALASELWDGRDKWIGLASPVVLTVIGLAVGVAAGGRAHWMHESWVYLNVVSRVAPALGAGYLAWRCQRPRGPSSLPPFSKPYRAS